MLTQVLTGVGAQRRSGNCSAGCGWSCTGWPTATFATMRELTTPLTRSCLPQFGCRAKIGSSVPPSPPPRPGHSEPTTAARCKPAFHWHAKMPAWRRCASLGTRDGWKGVAGEGGRSRRAPCRNTAVKRATGTQPRRAADRERAHDMIGAQNGKRPIGDKRKQQRGRWCHRPGVAREFACALESSNEHWAARGRRKEKKGNTNVSVISCRLSRVSIDATYGRCGRDGERLSALARDHASNHSQREMARKR